MRISFSEREADKKAPEFKEFLKDHGILSTSSADAYIKMIKFVIGEAHKHKISIGTKKP